MSPAAKKTAARRAAPAEAQEDLFSKLARMGTEVENERDKLTLNLGEHVVARLVGIREGTSKDKPKAGEAPEKYRIYDLDTQEEESLFLLGGADLDAKLSGNLVGHVVAILNAGTKDVGQVSPMKVFRVIDLGTDFPDLDLPF